MGPLLALDGIDRRFGPVVALRQAHVGVRAGSVQALPGVNGAGKTTLMRIGYGLIATDARSRIREAVGRAMLGVA